MKNHIRVDGKLLQTNKKWSALKLSQREWILELTRNEHILYVERKKRLPLKKHKDEVIDAVYAKLDEREVWIPYHEFHSHVASYIDRLNRRSPLLKTRMLKTELTKPDLSKSDSEEIQFE